MSLNKAQLIGNLGADPETRTANSGTMIANLRIATNEKVKRNGEWEDHTEWHKVVCFGRTAENVARYCSKGKQIYVEGRLRTTKWQDRDGNDRWTTEIVADRIQFLGGGSNEGNRGGGGNGGGYSSGNGGGYSSGNSSNNGGGGERSYDAPDDDIPF